MVKYPFDNRIHNLGNVGFGGIIHANIAPYITKFIDKNAYNGRNIREEVNNYLITKYHTPKVLDLCCGVGFSTLNYGIDTSPQFIKKARELYPNKKFEIANAENYKPTIQFDVVTCMFSFHEMPEDAHNLIIKNSLNIAKKEIIIIDISTNYKPSKIMLLGEPYVKKYQNSINDTMKKYNFIKKTYIKNHVDFWHLIKY